VWDGQLGRSHASHDLNASIRDLGGIRPRKLLPSGIPVLSQSPADLEALRVVLHIEVVGAVTFAFLEHHGFAPTIKDENVRSSLLFPAPRGRQETNDFEVTTSFKACEERPEYLPKDLCVGVALGDPVSV